MTRRDGATDRATKLNRFARVMSLLMTPFVLSLSVFGALSGASLSAQAEESSQRSLLSDTSLDQQASEPLSRLNDLSDLKTECPRLPSVEELLHRARSLDHACIDGGLSSPDQRSKVIAGRESVSRDKHAEWIVESLAIEMRTSGGIGWRVYRPTLKSPQRLPTRAPISPACASAFELFLNQSGQLRAIERWALKSPAPGEALSLSLAHPRYETALIRLGVSSTLSDRSRWLWRPQGVCPSLLPAGGEASDVQLTPLLACGEGAGPSLKSRLVWKRIK